MFVCFYGVPSYKPPPFTEAAAFAKSPRSLFRLVVRRLPPAPLPPPSLPPRDDSNKDIASPTVLPADDALEPNPLALTPADEEEEEVANVG